MRRLLRHREAGQGLVEHAMVLPLLLLIFLGIIEFGSVVFQYNTVANAAREGARAGIIQVMDGAWVDEAYVKGIAVERGLALNLSQDDVIVTLTVDTVTVEVNHTATLLTGPIIDVMGYPNVELHSVVTMKRE